MHRRAHFGALHWYASLKAYCTSLSSALHSPLKYIMLHLQRICSICTSEVLQCTEVLHCRCTANALQVTWDVMWYQYFYMLILHLDILLNGIKSTDSYKLYIFDQMKEGTWKMELRRTTHKRWNELNFIYRNLPIKGTPYSLEGPSLIITDQNSYSFFNNCPILNPKPSLESLEPQLCLQTIRCDLARAPGALIRQNTVWKHFYFPNEFSARWQ